MHPESRGYENTITTETTCDDLMEQLQQASAVDE